MTKTALPQDRGPSEAPPARPSPRDAAIALHRAGRLDEAFAAYLRLLRTRPDDAGIWTNLGALLRRRGDRRMAVFCQRRAHAIAGGDASILSNLGNALQDADMCGEALDARREVLRRRPDDPTAHAMVAVTLRSLNRNREAAAVAEAALPRWPDHPELRLQRSLALLALGDYERGFAGFGARWEVGEISRPDCAEPEWNGEDLAGRRILVLPEQGFGDTILMTRFLPALKARGGTVTLACKAPLLRLFAGLPGVDALLPVGGRKPPVDFVVPMMELPRLLGARRDALPPAPPLSIPQDARARGRRIVAPFAGKLKIGVVWSGSPTYKANHKRSIDPERLLPLAEMPGTALFSLCKGPALDRLLSSGLSAAILDASGDDRDFADAAGLIAALDLVITIDSAAAHLAASLGRPTWNLLAFSPYWLYGSDGARTPWHPSMRLFRKRAPGDWDGVMSDVEAALRNLSGGGER